MGDFGVVLVAVDVYPDPPGALPSSDSAAAFAAVLGAFGGTVRANLVAADEAGLVAALRHWANDETGPLSSIVYLVGHGRGDMTDHEFVLPDGSGGVVGFPTTRLGEFLHPDWWRRQADPTAWTLVVLDCCDSDVGVTNLFAHLSRIVPKKPRRLALWPVAPGGAARTGAFVDAFTRALATFTDNDTAIRLDEVFRLIRPQLGGDLEPAGFLPDEAVLTPATPGPPVVMTLDVHAELRRAVEGLAPEVRNHFVAKAQGSEVGEVAWHFTGRHDELTALCQWAAGGSNLQVVTGDAGSGKSALLGHLVVLADADLVSLYADSGLAPHLATGPRPPDDAFGAVLHLTGKTALETIDALADQLGLTSMGDDDPAASPREVRARTGALVHAVRLGQRHGAVVLVDALDEAQEPAAIAALLRDLTADGLLRVLVGTRRSLTEGPDRPASAAGRELLDALGVADADVLVVGPDRGAVAAYATRRLARPGSPYADVAGAADALAARVAAADQPFLFARLVTAELLARPPMAPGDPVLDALLGSGHRGVFAAAVDRIAAADPAAGALVHALAYARGRGLPRTGGVWVEAARSLDPASPPAGLDDARIEATIALAGPYVTLDAEAGQSTYRLAHQTFVEHFHRAAGHGSGHRRIAAQLRRQFGGEPDRWRTAPFYAVRYVSEHLVADADRTPPDADGLDGLVTDGGWLARAVTLLGVDRTVDAIAAARRVASGPGTMVDALERTLRRSRIALGREPAQLGAQLTARLGRESPAALAGLGDGVATVVGLPWLRTTGGSLDWRADLDTTLGLVGKVRALAFGTVDDRPLVAIAIDARVVLWDPRSGVPDEAGAIDLVGHRATGLALATIGGRAVVVTSAAYDQTTEVWDPVTGARLAAAPTDLGTTVTVGRLGDRPVLAGIGVGRDVRLLDAATLEPLPPPAWCEGHDVVGFAADATGALVALTIEWFAADGTPWQPSTPAFESRPAIAVRTAADGTVRWRTAMVDGVDHRFDAVAAGLGADGALLVAAAAGPLAYRLDVDTEEVVESRHGVRTRALAVGAFEGRTVVASAPDYDSTTLVELAEPGAPGDDRPGDAPSRPAWFVEPEAVPAALWTSERERSDTFAPERPQHWPHRVAASGTLDGRAVVVTGSVDGVVWVWAADTDPPQPLAGPFGTLSERAHRLGWEGMRHKPGLAVATAVAYGTHPSAGPVAASACEGRVRLYAVPSGVPVAGPADGATVVDAVALGSIGDRAVLVTGSKGGQVVVWQLEPAARLAALTLDQPVARLWVAPGTGRIAVVTADDRCVELELVDPVD